jgi:hypothetical protein
MARKRLCSQLHSFSKITADLFYFFLMIINKMADFQRPLLTQTTEGQTEYGKKMYNKKWTKEKEDFQTQLKANFFNLIERQAEGKQELFLLCVAERKEKLYTEAFLDIFSSQYTPHISEVERLANKRVRKLFITLPQGFY